MQKTTFSCVYTMKRDKNFNFTSYTFWAVALIWDEVLWASGTAINSHKHNSISRSQEGRGSNPSLIAFWCVLSLHDRRMDPQTEQQMDRQTDLQSCVYMTTKRVSEHHYVIWGQSLTHLRASSTHLIILRSVTIHPSLWYLDIQHATTSVKFLFDIYLIAKYPILHLNMSVDGDEATYDHLDQLECCYCHHDLVRNENQQLPLTRYSTNKFELNNRAS